MKNRRPDTKLSARNAIRRECARESNRVDSRDTRIEDIAIKINRLVIHRPLIRLFGCKR